MTRMMRRSVILVALLVGTVSLAASAVSAAAAIRGRGDAAAASRDRASTQSLIRIMSRYYATVTQLLAQSDRAGKAFIAHVSQACPSALGPAGLSPDQLPVANALNLEAGFDQYITEFDVPFRAANLAAAKALKPLRWSSGATTRLIQKVPANLAYAARERPTDACYDINGAKASGFKQVPQATQNLLAQVNGIPKPAGWSTVLRQLQPSIAGSELPAVRRFVRIYDAWFSAGAMISARNSLRLNQILGTG